MHPPVFVMNPYYSGVGVARRLHARGVPVSALASEPEVPGARSRMFDRVYRVPNGRDEPDALESALLRIAAAIDAKPVVFPTRDFDVLFLHEHRAALAEAFTLPHGGDPSILRLMDKLELASIAAAAGVAAPATVVARSAADLERETARLRLPIVVKPRFAYQWRRRDVWSTVAQKAFVVETIGELRALSQRLAHVADDLLAQEYVAGDDRDIVVCCCCIGRDGELLGHFTARKLRQNPPRVGTGSVVEAVDVPALLEPSMRLLRSAGYRGLAEVEYKLDPARDDYVLIEVNPRHWDQHELGTLVGVDLTWLAYADLVGLRPQRVAPVYAPGKRYKWIAEPELAEDFVRTLVADWRSVPAARGMRGRLAAALGALARLRELASGRKVYATFRANDPMPAIVAARDFAGQAIGALGRSLARRRETRRAIL